MRWWQAWNVCGLVLVVAACASLDERAYEQARQSDTAREYQSFLVNFPTSPHAAAVRSRLDDLKFAHARHTGTADAVAAYLSWIEGSDPGSPHRAEAQRLLDDFAYREAATDGREAALRRYLADHPAGAHVGEIRASLDGLVAGMAGERYRALRDSASYSALRSYLRDYPDSPHAADVRRRLGRFEVSRTSQDLVVPYRVLGWADPVVPDQAVTASAPKGGTDVTGRAGGDYVFTGDELVIVRGTFLPGVPRGIAPGKLALARVQGGYRIRALDGQGFVLRNLRVVLPLGTAFAVADFPWSGAEVVEGTLRLTEHGLALLAGATIAKMTGAR
ncbi:MAG: hypothetical protein GC151_01590 [Betaproteobacteria bacterium]|nr:hypothetical protein [Betaproteobacteria bacterium]